MLCNGTIRTDVMFEFFFRRLPRYVWQIVQRPVFDGPAGFAGAPRTAAGRRSRRGPGSFVRALVGTFPGQINEWIRHLVRSIVSHAPVGRRHGPKVADVPGRDEEGPLEAQALLLPWMNVVVVEPSPVHGFAKERRPHGVEAALRMGVQEHNGKVRQVPFLDMPVHGPRVPPVRQCVIKINVLPPLQEQGGPIKVRRAVLLLDGYRRDVRDVDHVQGGSTSFT
jgi:hypothetical protein